MEATDTDPGEKQDKIEAALEDLVVDPTRFGQTDAGNALLFVALNGTNIRYIEAWRTWAVWNGRRWEMLSDTALLPMARAATEYMLDWAPSLPDDRKIALRKHALSTQKEQRLHAMINLAKGEPSIRAEPSTFDANPWLLACENVTINLHDNNKYPPRREDFITKSTGVKFDPKAECPQFKSTLNWALKGDAATIDFLQRLAGYALTGLVSEEKLFAFFGGGANGKTTIAMTLFDALGDYADKGRGDLLLHSQGDKGAASPDIAALHGKRLIVVSETDDGCAIAEAQLKAITSNEPIRARKLHKDPFTFIPTHKVLLMTNHRPFVKGTDDGIWRRMSIVEFNAAIPEDQKISNFREDDLRPELPGILRWMIIGCLKWQVDGLKPSAGVEQAISNYRFEMDFIQQWLDEETVADLKASISRRDAYSNFEYWSKEQRTPILGNRRFTEELHRRGFPTAKSNGVRRYKGLRLRSAGPGLRVVGGLGTDF